MLSSSSSFQIHEPTDKILEEENESSLKCIRTKNISQPYLDLYLYSSTQVKCSIFPLTTWPLQLWKKKKKKKEEAAATLKQLGMSKNIKDIPIISHMKVRSGMVSYLCESIYQT